MRDAAVPRCCAPTLLWPHTPLRLRAAPTRLQRPVLARLPLARSPLAPRCSRPAFPVGMRAVACMWEPQLRRPALGGAGNKGVHLRLRACAPRPSCACNHAPLATGPLACRL